MMMNHVGDTGPRSTASRPAAISKSLSRGLTDPRSPAARMSISGKQGCAPKQTLSRQKIWNFSIACGAEVRRAD